MIKIEKLGFRLSNRGVPHQLVRYQSFMFNNENNPSVTRNVSICWFGKGQFYRMFDWDSNERLVDIPLKPGEVVTIEEMIERMILERTQKAVEQNPLSTE